ncbi:MAG: polysaccharide biosynthesis C-terminal domain-containing protein [Myxococcota bacterium]|nr:polysaccharide biosynthesis C-terminal domain-containing protein [Myxococcota bacterium]
MCHGCGELLTQQAASDSGGLIKLAQRMASGVFIVTMLGQGLGFGLQLLLARSMDVDAYGVYIYVFSWLMVVAIGVVLGQTQVLLRFVAGYRAENKPGELRGLVSFSHRLVALASVLASVSVAVAVIVLKRADSELGVSILVACAILPLISLKNIQMAIAHSLRRVVLAKGMDEVAIRGGQGLLFLAIWWGVGRVPLPHETLALLGVSSLLAGLYVGWAWRRGLGSQMLSGARVAHHNMWFKTGLALLVVDGLNMLLNRTDVLLLGLLRDTTDAGTYAVSSRLAALTLLGFLVIQSSVLPMLAERFAVGEMGALQRLVRWTARMSAALSLALGLGLIFLGEFLLGIFGVEFQARVPALLVLTIGQMLNAFTGPTGILLWVTGREQILAKLLAASLVINVVLNLWWIPLFGVVGAAYATVVAYTSWNVVAVFVIRRQMRINSLPLSWFDLPEPQQEA